ncbi:methyltransferase family protein [Salinarchaeum sp. Harcht-Bsk1]|nr:methyltransferase family protein [Salinarchaeum sp. Harcht-Bsk1]
MVADYHRDALAGQPTYERSDGDESTAQCAWYFAGPEDWGSLETTVIEACAAAPPGQSRATPRVLDAGCGPGRALGPLADRGADVLGIDESPGAIQVAREWTGQPAIVGDLATPPLASDAFDAALFLGTHVGTGGSISALRDLLAELDRVLAPRGRIVADMYDPTAVEAEDLSEYLDGRWLADGVATRRFRLRYDGTAGRWRTLLMASPDALETIVAPTSWSIGRVERDEGTRHLFVLERGADR